MTKASIGLLLSLITLSYQVKVFDLAGVFKDYTCMKNAGFQHGIIRAYHSYGAIDVDAPDNIQLCNKAGISTDAYMFPCRGKEAAKQVNELIDFLDQMKLKKDVESAFQLQTGTIWLDIETNPSSGCTWSQGSYDSNCEYVQQLITAIEQRGRAVGIYASGYMWNQIFGSKQNCQRFAAYPLWYAHYDNKTSFDDWTVNQFGGWEQPAIKQYAGDAVECGFRLDLSYF